jgi:PAS domain S-box-containing protein
MTYSILLVEDNPGDAELVRIALRESPSLGAFDIHHVDRMEEAIAAAADKRYDAILLDLNLPDSSGLETLAVLGACSSGDPIVVLTGSDDELLGLKALRNGAHDYLVKGQVFGTMMARAVLYAIQRHRTDAALRTTEAQHRILFETMAQGAVYYDAAGQIIDANPAALQFFGRSLEELRNHTVDDSDWKMVRGDATPFEADEHPTSIALRTGLEKNSTVIGIFNPMERQHRWMMVHARPHFRPGESKPYQVFTTFTDITALRRAEEALRTNEERFRTLIEHAYDMTVVVSRDGLVTYCSPSISRIIGYEAEAVVGMHFLEMCAEQDRERAQEALSRIIGEPNASASGVWVARHADGSSRRLEVFTRNLLHHAAIEGIVANVRDTTESYEADQRVRAVNEQLAAVVDTSPLAILVVDELRNVQIWNRAAERIFGWTAEEVVGKPYPLIAPPDALDVRSVFLSAFEGHVVQGLELKRLTKAGEIVDIKLWNEQLRDANGNITGLVGVIADMSEQKELEDALHHAQKMEAVGRLAGGIAHDFNNILTALSGHAGLLLDEMPEQDPLRDDVIQIEKGVDRAAMLT